jgi:hypothetical protein
MFRLNRSVVLLLILLLSVQTHSPASGCETPVYRYAMYRWAPAPYVMYVLHDRPVGPMDRLVAERLNKARQSDDQANVAHQAVDLSASTEGADLPAEIREIGLQTAEKSLPHYVLVNPQGMPVFQGAIEPNDLPKLLQSPARKALGGLLQDGNIGVFVYLPGAVAEENQRIEQLLETLRTDLAVGNLTLRPSGQPADPAEETSAPNLDRDAAPAAAGERANPTDRTAANAAASGNGESAGTQPATPVAASEVGPARATGNTPERPATETASTTEIGVLTVQRDDPAETWFVRSLLALESDLEAESQPMVFLVYGRARSLLPYIGPGITRENLVRELQFISGACSCTVKEQNPGIDLLVQYDWEAASASLAERFGIEEGNEQQFGPGGFFPELIIPSAPPAARVDVAGTTALETPALGTTDSEVVSTRSAELLAEEESGGNREATAQANANSLPAGDVARSAADARGDAPSDAAGAAMGQATGASSRSPAVTPASPQATLPVNSDSRELAALPAEPTRADEEVLSATPFVASWLTIATGLAIAFVVLVGITFMVMRPR